MVLILSLASHQSDNAELLGYKSYLKSEEMFKSKELLLN